MNNYDTDTHEVLGAVSGSLDEITMSTPVEQIIAAGRTRLFRRRLATTATAVVAVAGVALGVSAYANPPAAPPPAANGTGDVHIRTVAYTVDQNADGTIGVTWDKQRYFDDRAGLEQALRAAGFPVLIKVGEFCHGPHDDASLDPGGTGPGVDLVMNGRSEADGKVTFVFIPAAMPPGKQLFIGYLSPAQLEVTHGAPGSVERLISTGVPLTCNSVAPPPHERTGDSQGPSKGTERR